MRAGHAPHSAPAIQLVFAFALAGLGCGASPAGSARPPVEPRAAPPAHAPEQASAGATALGRDATFGDLVRAAAARIERADLAAHAPCTLRAHDGGYALDAELMPALQEIPEPLPDLDAALRAARGPIRALTAWGQVGAIEPELALAAFTALPAQSLRQPAVALVATNEGVYLRYGAASADDADGPLAAGEVVPRLLAQPHAADAVLYVSAEAGTPLSSVAALLRELPHQRTVALALVLPPGTRLPPLAAARPPARLCPDGLPEPAADAPLGELDAAAVVEALGPLRAGASACLSAASADARAGGRLLLALRVAADGSVQDACLMQDGIGDAALAECVLQSARAARLPAPEPKGLVDVHVPLVLSPEAPPHPRALCD